MFKVVSLSFLIFLFSLALYGHAKVEIPLGDLNEKAKLLPMPKVTGNVRPRPPEMIRVRVKVNLSTGGVADAKMESGEDPFNDEAVLKAARNAKFEAVLPEFQGLRGTGIITYRSTDFNRPDRVNNRPQAFIIEKKTLNDRAVEFPKPPCEGYFKGAAQRYG